MYIVIDKNKKFIGFSLKEEENYTNIKISESEHNTYIEKQAQGYVFYFNKDTEELEAIKLDQFEYINERGNIIKDTDAEKKYKNSKIIELKREWVQLKKDMKDFVEFEEDTTELEKRIDEITKELEV